MLPRYCIASGVFDDAHMDDFYAIMRKKTAYIVRRIRGNVNTLGNPEDSMDSAIVGRFSFLQ